MRSRSFDVAVIGMACVFPGAPDLAGYWSNVVAGVDSVTEVEPGRWPADRHWTTGGSPSQWGGFLAPMPFDALAHGVPPASLGSIEPAQLLALETATRALADAGYAERPFDRTTTSVVIAAEAGADLAAAYAARSVLALHTGDLPTELDARLPRLTEDSFPGTLANVIAGRIANRLDLGGANYAVDAACASSLAALDQACKELLAGTSDMVLCGGVDTHNGLHDYLMFGSVQALSPTGRCRAFDATADGIVLAEGVACVVLKRLADAEAAGDRVYAVIKGVGAASDGRARGLTAPRPEGQRQALDRAYAIAGVAPRDVGLVEAHGTGTVLGDRTELESLTGLFAEAAAEPGACSLGSVKSLIGHTKCAAGLAGLIKAVLAVHGGVRPPTGHLREPNPAWQAATSPFAFDTTARPWPAADRIAGVSAVGFGGINYHAVVAAHGPAEDVVADWPAELLLFRGGGDEVRAALRALRDRLTEHTRLRELAGTVGTGPVRVAIVADGVSGLRTQIDLALRFEDAPALGVHVAAPGTSRPVVALLFPGQGSQRPGMLADLFVAFPRLHRFLRMAGPLADVMFPAAAFDDAAGHAARDRLVDTRAAQPALGVTSLAMLDLLRSFGVEPDLVGGHSYGELVALAAAGALAEDAVPALSAARAEAMHAAAGTDPGAMAAVTGSADDVLVLLATTDVVVANHNSPDQVVIAGSAADIDAAVLALRSAGHTPKRLPVAAAFHSTRMAPAAEHFARTLAATRFSPAAVPVWSGATAAPYPADPDAAAALLADSLVRPVRFAEQVERMYASGARVFVEAGPGTVLTRLVGAVLGDRPHVALSCEAPGRPALPHLLGTLAALAVRGVPVQPPRQGVPAPDRPWWTVDGQLVRLRGEPVDGGLRPAGQPVALRGDERDQTVIEFLRGTQQTIAAQQEVVLRYLGAARPPVLAVEPPPAIETTPVAPSVLDLVAQRTGYPPELLDPDLDLEAVLGVDSLKRTEIAATLLDGTPHAGAAGELADLRTIRGMTDWLAARSGDRPRRYVVEPRPATADVPSRDWTGTQVTISGGGQVGDELAAVLKERGAEVVTGPVPGGGYVLLDALAGEPVLPRLFPAVKAAVLAGVRTLAMATCHEQDTTGAGLHGLARAVAVEHPEIRSVAVDVPSGQSPAATARWLADELGAARPSIGHADGKRAVWRTSPSDLPHDVTAERLGLDRDSVLLVAGGARGITARAVVALARLTGCHVELLGRTPLVATPDGDDAALRARLIAEGGTAADIERRVRANAAGRDLHACLDELRAVAASVRYHRADVRDTARLHAVIDDVYDRHGRLDTVIFAAGVVRDAKLRDKTPESFADVFHTKVSGARALVARLRPGLRHLVLFGSVAGVLGNTGQVDYAAANDALDTLAHHWAQQRVADRVVAVDWGPWAAEAGGMVSAELAREYTRRGVGLIDADAGVTCLLRELAFGRDPQVLWFAGDPTVFVAGHHG